MRFAGLHCWGDWNHFCDLEELRIRVYPSFDSNTADIFIYCNEGRIGSFLTLSKQDFMADLFEALGAS
jgi:hypothetical protein